MTAVYNFRQWE